MPNSCSQNRLTATRAVNGLLLPPIQFAKSKRLLTGPFLNKAGIPGCTGSAGFNQEPRANTRVVLAKSAGFSSMTGVVNSGSAAMAFRAKFSNSVALSAAGTSGNKAQNPIVAVVWSGFVLAFVNSQTRSCFPGKEGMFTKV